MTPQTHLTILLVSTAGVGVLMSLAGLQEERARVEAPPPHLPFVWPPAARPALLV
jgi:hypothetical protein